MKQAIIPVVNRRDKIIGYKPRGEVCLSDMYRVSALFLVNSQGEILFAQRSFKKKHDPGKWAASVAGTVEKGESYRQNILKETREELGLKLSRLQKGPKILIHSKHKFFCQWYFARIDRASESFRIKKDEVAAVRWIAPATVQKLLRQKPAMFIVSAPKRYPKILRAISKVL